MARPDRGSQPASIPPPARMMLVLVLLAIAAGIAVGYWIFASLT